MFDLTLAMIVRNAERDLDFALNSVAGRVKEIVIGDTGCTDRTLEIARAHGARIVPIEWCDDFAAARNRVLDAVLSSWVLVLDADEELDCESALLLPRLLEQNTEGYQVRIRNYVSDITQRIWDRPAVPNRSEMRRAKRWPAFIEHENVRLFRNHPSIRFSGRVHETVGPAVEARGPIGPAALLIHHFGLVEPKESRAAKNATYRELGRKKIAEQPDDAQAHFELGLVEFDNFNDYAQAARLFERAAKLKPALAVAHLFAGLARHRVQDFDLALQHLENAERAGGITPLLLECRGDIWYEVGALPHARKNYARALKMTDSPLLVSKIGLVEVRQGEVEAGLGKLRRALKEAPERPDLYDNAITAHIHAGQLGRAALFAEQKLRLPSREPRWFVRAASIRARLAQAEIAALILGRGLQEFPKDTLLTQADGEIREMLIKAAGAPADVKSDNELSAGGRGCQVTGSQPERKERYNEKEPQWHSAF